MEKHFMIDIEATGIDPAKEALLSIGILECEFENRFWQPKRSKEWIVRCERQPESEFAKEHMTALYAKCNAAPQLTTERLRWEVLDFIRGCGTTGPDDTYFMGWNASNFDIPFLVAKGVLVPSSYELGPDGKDRMVGDFHYRIYEMGGALSLTQNARCTWDRKTITEMAKELQPRFPMPPGKQHDALFDCYHQLHLLNGLLELVRAS